MVNYSNGKIYKIESLDGKKGDIYIGSTTRQYLSQRMDKHRSGYKRWKAGKDTSHVRSYDLFDTYGIENCEIILLEKFSCESKDELEARERHYITTLKCVNKLIPQRTQKEYTEDHKEEKQAYDKIYSAEHKDDKIKYDKQYKIDNKDIISERRKEKFVCECGVSCGINDKARHFRSITHKTFIELTTPKEVKPTKKVKLDKIK